MPILNRRDLLVQGALALAGGSFPRSLRQASSDDSVDMKTLAYASRGDNDLHLDLYLPQSAGRKLPVIIFVHGGGWFGGDRTAGPDFRKFFAHDGFAMASIDYRLTTTSTFPANAEDVKTAIRWVKANAATYGLDEKRVGLWGTSAGGHLAAIAGLSPANMFEGDGNRDQSSSVRCVLDAYGPSSFAAMDTETEAEKATLQKVAPALASLPAVRSGGAHTSPSSPESKLLGAPIDTVPEKVHSASPLTYVKHGAPPFLIMHGMADDTVPHSQSVLLYEALKAADCDATLRLVDGLPHGFFNRNNVDDLAGPSRMDVREHKTGKRETVREERTGVYPVARDFFRRNLLSGLYHS